MFEMNKHLARTSPDPRPIDRFGAAGRLVAGHRGRLSSRHPDRLVAAYVPGRRVDRSSGAPAGRRPRPGTGVTSPRRSATSSKRRSASPKPSGSSARFRVASCAGSGERVASIARKRSRTAGTVELPPLNRTRGRLRLGLDELTR